MIRMKELDVEIVMLVDIEMDIVIDVVQHPDQRSEDIETISHCQC